MTITSIPSEISYAGDGVSTVFNLPFVFGTSSDLKVIETDSNGNPVVVTSGFSVAGGGGATGTLTRLLPLPSGTTLTILDNPERTQEADYTDNDAFPATTHEGALDRGVRISKRIYQLLLKCVRVDDGDPGSGAGMLLGSVQARKGKYLFFNAVTGAIEYAVALATTALSQSIIAQLLNPQTAAEAIAGIVPTNYAIPSHASVGVIRVERYGFDRTTTTANQSTSINSAIAVANALSGGIIEFPAADFRASVTVTTSGIVFRGQGGVSGATRWRNVGAAAPLTWSNVSSNIVGGGVERLELRNQNSATFTTTDGLVLTGTAVLNLLDYLCFRDFVSTGFRDGVSITGRTIWNTWDQVRCQQSLRDGFHIDSVDNVSMQSWKDCRFGDNARHGWYANHTISAGGLLLSGHSFLDTNFENNGQNGYRLTGTGGTNGTSFRNCYDENNGAAISPAVAGPTMASFYVDSVYALGFEIDGQQCFNPAGREPQYYVYVDTAITVNVAGSIANSRFGNIAFAGGGVYWPAGCMFHSNNTWAGTNVIDIAQGSVSIHAMRDVLQWTPTLKFGGSATGFVYTNQRGWWSISGRSITVGAYISISTKGSGAGAVTIEGLPVALINKTNFIITVPWSGDQFAGGLAAPTTARMNPGTTVLNLLKLVAGGQTPLLDTDCSNNMNFSFEVTYQV